MTSSPTDEIQPHLDRLLAGDETARSELIRLAHQRLLRLARRMLRDFPGVQRWEDTDDVMQNATLRLHAALSAVAPPTTADFLRLAASQLRRELIDLSRHYFGPQGHGANYDSHQARTSDQAVGAKAAETDTHEPCRLAMWTEFHRYVDLLPDVDRALYDLLWYQGLTQASAAQVLNVTERTIQRRWQQLRLDLHGQFKGEPPIEG